MSYFADQVYHQMQKGMRGLPQPGFLRSLDSESAATQLLRHGETWIVPDNGPVVLTYSFMNAGNFPGYDPGITEFVPFSAEEKAATRQALQRWSDVANIVFEEKHSGIPEIFFGHGEGLNLQGGITWNYTGPDHYIFNSNVWIMSSPLPPDMGGYPFHILVHEIGHALGLSHPGDYDVHDDIVPMHTTHAGYVEDNTVYTVMSYWNEFYGGGDYHATYPSGPLIDDITAVQRLYGPNPNAFAGNTIYGFGSNTGRESFTFHSDEDKKVFCVYDSGGNDTFDFSGFLQDQVIDIRPGAFSNVGGLSKNVSIAENTQIENIIGGSGNDILIGNNGINFINGHAGDNIIYGGLGADLLSGGPGTNVFVYLDIRDSTPTSADCIMDFKAGTDRIDLSAITDHLSSVIHADYDVQHHVTNLYANTDGAEQFLVHITGQVNLQTDLIVD